MRTPIIVALVASLCLAATALAEDYDWNTEVSTSGNWSDTTEWSSTTGSYPGAVAGDIARIQSEWPSATIVVDGDYALSELRIEKGNRSPHYASLTLDGTANTLTVSDAVALGNDASANRQNIKCMLSGTADLTMTGGLFRLNSTANTLTGQTYITGGELEVYSVGTGTINVSGGGSLNPCQTLANPIVFDGGQYELLFNGAPGTAFTGTVTLAAGGGTFAGGASSGATRVDVNGKVTGPGQFIVDAGNNGTELNSPDNDYTGGTWLKSGALYISADGALPAGTVVVDDGADRPYYDGLVIRYEQTAGPDSITVNSGGLVQFATSANYADRVYDMGIVSNGGAIYGSGANVIGYHATITLTGTITMNADTSFGLGTYSTDKLYLTGLIEGAGKLVKDGGTQHVYINNAAGPNTYTGGTEVSSGYVDVLSVGGLGTGTAVAKGGFIVSGVDDAFASVPEVVADENGTVILGSIENNALIHVLPGGGFTVSAGAAYAGTLNYSGVPDAGAVDVLVEKGCILDANLPSFPAAADFLPGDGGYGAFKAATSGSHDVGTASNTIYRGLAATANATFNAGSVTETAGGTEGIGMLATGPATFTYQNSTFTTSGSNTLKLYGAGNHVIAGGNTFNNDIEKFGTGMVRVSATDAVTGRTLTVREGWLDLDHDSALGGAVAVIESGASFVLDRTVAAGSVVVKGGGGVYMDKALLRGADAHYTFEAGSQVGVNISYGTGAGNPLPGAGVSDYLFTNGNPAAASEVTDDMVLGDSTRGMNMPEDDGDTRNMILGPNSGYGGTGSAGTIRLATGATRGMLAAIDGTYLEVRNPIDFGADTLLINETGAYNAMAAGGEAFYDVDLTGEVRLTNDSNVIGNIKVQAGRLRVDNAARLGGASAIDVAAGAELYLYTSMTLDATITGNGAVAMQSNSYRLTLGAGGALSPGNSVGQLAVNGDLTLDAGRMIMEIESTGGVAGTDHDYIVVADNANIGNGELVLRVPAPRAGLVPGDLNATLLTAGTLTGTFTPVTVECPQPLNGAVDPATVASFYDFSSSLDYSGDQVTVVGTGTTWTAHDADANLDNAVDVFDLAVLANNYQVVGAQDWTTADYDLSGIVDVFDLATLANNYGWTTGGGDPVPEPATLALLAIGGAALIRRRRR